MNTRQHCFTRMMICAAASLACMAVWHPELAWVAALFGLIGALANMAAGLMVEP